MKILSRIRAIVGKTEASDPRIAVFGDSHTVALLRAKQYSKRTHEYEHINVSRLRKKKGGTSVGDASLNDFCREISDFRPGDYVFSAIGGNQYAIVSTVRSAVDYDFLSSASDDAYDPTAQLVPFRALAGFIEDGVRETIGPVLRKIRSSTQAKVFHLAPPPPKQDNEFIVAHAEGYFTKEGLQDLGPTRPDLRLKCWRLQLNILSDLCGELGMRLVMPPERTITVDGYLDPICYANDVTHANRRYGEAVCRQIIRITKIKAHARAKAG